MLIIIRGYVQIYYDHLLLLDRVLLFKNFSRIPFVYYDKNKVLKVLMEVNLYLLIPLSMVMFVDKLSALPRWTLWMSMSSMVITAFHMYTLRKGPARHKKFYISILSGLLAFSVCSFLFFLLKPTKSFVRPMNLQHADLNGSNLTEHYLEKANLQEADLREAKLSRVNLKKSKLQYANLSKVQLFRADLTHADIMGANLNYSYLAEANLSYACLEYSQLKNANLKQVDFSHANLKRAYLKDAKLHNAKLTGAKLYHANLKRARLYGADLSKAKGLNQKMINSALGDLTTKLPSGLVYPKSWLTESPEDWDEDEDK